MLIVGCYGVDDVGYLTTFPLMHLPTVQPRSEFKFRALVPVAAQFLCFANPTFRTISQDQGLICVPVPDMTPGH